MFKVNDKNTRATSIANEVSCEIINFTEKLLHLGGTYNF